MSTRIYTGFRMQTDSFAAAMKAVEAFRPWVLAKADEVLKTYINMVQKDKPELTRTQAYMLWLDWRERLVRQKGAYLPGLDTDFSLSFIPAGGQLLGIAYTSHNSWYEAWCQQPGVEAYSYWTNSDGPADLSASEWAERGKAWDVMTYEPVDTQSFHIKLVSDLGPTL
ncbi:hypothetical protein [Paraburkholderia sp. A3RO-2L]|uniref:hypothetical protein n=1 Tax=unclassified Paraburkholderia TaxID=2615204 RepID=UPI003DA9B1C2